VEHDVHEYCIMYNEDEKGISDADGASSSAGSECFVVVLAAAALSPPPADDVQKKNFDDKIELRILIELQNHASGEDFD